MPTSPGPCLALLKFVAPDGQVSKRRDRLVSAGTGPYTRKTFNASVTNHTGRRVFRLDNIGDGEIIIVGSRLSESERDELREIIKAKEGEPLLVYSQEMFIAFILSGRCPFEEGRADEFADGHATLEWLKSEWVEWPEGYSPPGEVPLIKGPWPQIGLLKACGYSTDLTKEERRSVLSHVYSTPLSKLPSVDSPEYMKGWGAHSSGTRLQKIANSVHAFAALRHKQDVAGGLRKVSKPVAAWTADLDWMREHLYVGLHKFDWPRAIVAPDSKRSY